ncbi:MAG: serine/threonine protein kinase, partial [Rhodanobacteraceae bacterium]
MSGSNLVGQTIGNYRIEALLGTGGMGQVYRANHALLNRPAAIKVMHANLASDATFQARFIQEAKSVAALN